MVQPCSKCARANPPAGAYCFFCGVALGNADRQAVAVGSRAFNAPFVFPSGRACRSFDELALACHDDWKTASGLLKDGYLESFLGGMGRIDLALAAKEASRFPDPDRGLDQLLAKLPSTVLAEPRLRVDPAEVSLGVLDADTHPGFTLELDNQGKRLLHGTVTSDAVWLTLGEAGISEKAFHFIDEDRIAVHVRPERVRAGGKPVVGKLLVSSNAGAVTVTVRAEKPVRAFQGGPLSGAKTPREIAQKAKESAKEVGPFFENGDVERWYASNGWVYPVKVPAASGIAAIQQFFEALGLTKPPEVAIDQRKIALSASPGEKLSLSVEVSTPEKKAVFAHVTSNVPWIEVGKAKLAGRTASVPMSVPSVPDRPGEVLAGELTVVSNGNARWVVPVTLDVTGAAFDFLPSDEAPARPKPPPPPPSKVRTPAVKPRKPTDVVALMVHAFPALLLLAAVLSVFAYEQFGRAPAVAAGTPADVLGPKFDASALPDRRPRVRVGYDGENHFGLVRVNEGAPDDSSAWKKLTFREKGETNSTMIKVGPAEHRFGYVVPGHEWDPRAKAIDLRPPYVGRRSVFRFNPDEVEVTQYVQVVPGPSGALDTVLVYYRVRNTGSGAKSVQVRLLLDTLIGANDNVPFLVPGRSDLVKQATLSGKDVPEYLEAVENPNDPANPGTVVRLGLRNLKWDKVEPVEPSEVLIGQMGNARAWREELKPIADDSCVIVYWPETEVKPKAVAHFALTYGLGALEVSENLGVTAPGSVLPGRDFTVTGYVYKAKKGQKVTLELPAGLEAVEGVEKEVSADAERAQLFWKVRGVREGTYAIHAVADKTRSKPVRVAVKASGVFG